MLSANLILYARAKSNLYHDTSGIPAAHLHTLRRLADHHLAEILDVVHILERNPVLSWSLLLLLFCLLVRLESSHFMFDILCHAVAHEIARSMTLYGALQTRDAHVRSGRGLRQALLEIPFMWWFLHCSTSLRGKPPANITNAITTTKYPPC